MYLLHLLGGENRATATAQQIVKSLNTTKEVIEGMLLIFSSFDNQLSNILNLIETKTKVFFLSFLSHDPPPAIFS